MQQRPSLLEAGQFIVGISIHRWWTTLHTTRINETGTESRRGAIKITKHIHSTVPIRPKPLFCVLSNVTTCQCGNVQRFRTNGGMIFNGDENRRKFLQSTKRGHCAVQKHPSLIVQVASSIKLRLQLTSKSNLKDCILVVLCTSCTKWWPNINSRKHLLSICTNW